MTAESNDRKPMKIRRRGRHARPSPAERAALQASRAAPAAALAGVLFVAPHAQHAIAASATPAVVSTQSYEAGSAHGGTPVQTATLDAYSPLGIGPVIVPTSAEQPLVAVYPSPVSLTGEPNGLGPGHHFPGITILCPKGIGTGLGNGDSGPNGGTGSSSGSRSGSGSSSGSGSGSGGGSGSGSSSGSGSRSGSGSGSGSSYFDLKNPGA
jgi:hypothetical protein